MVEDNGEGGSGQGNKRVRSTVTPAQDLQQFNIHNGTPHPHNICTNTTSVVVVVGGQWRRGKGRGGKEAMGKGAMGEGAMNGGSNGGGERESQKHSRTNTTSLAAQHP